MASQVEAFLTAEQEAAIIESIRKAELLTSGEIRVHLENSCQNPMARAQELFHQLKMDQTKESNGILFYVAVKDHKFAVIGDRGIHQKVGDAFWDQVRQVLEVRFRESEYQKGLVDGIQLVGTELAKFFPWQRDDVNELPDEISTS